jgi:glucose/arabinose dehydrogenase
VKTEEEGTYDPFAPDAAVTIFASGVRNAYDCTWHSNGQLYIATNGSAAGGNTPGTPNPLPSEGQVRIDKAIRGLLPKT